MISKVFPAWYILPARYAIYPQHDDWDIHNMIFKICPDISPYPPPKWCHAVKGNVRQLVISGPQGAWTLPGTECLLVWLLEWAHHRTSVPSSTAGTHGDSLQWHPTSTIKTWVMFHDQFIHTNYIITHTKNNPIIHFSLFTLFVFIKNCLPWSDSWWGLVHRSGPHLVALAAMSVSPRSGS